MFFPIQLDGLGHFIVRHYIGGVWYFSR